MPIKLIPPRPGKTPYYAGRAAAFDERAHEVFKCLSIAVDASQQHRLAHHRNAGVNDARDSRAGGRRELARMIGV